MSIRSIANAFRLTFWQLSNAVYIREGSWSFLPHEQTVIDAVVHHLPSDLRQLAENQLTQRYFVTRIGGRGRVNLIHFFDPELAFQLPGAEFMDSIFEITVNAESKKQRIFVRIRNGYFFDIELPKVPNFYRDLSEFTVVGVVQAKPNDGWAGEIDRATHGRTDPA